MVLQITLIEKSIGRRLKVDIKKLQSKTKALTTKIETLEAENKSRKNQYKTIFREFKKIKGRIGYLESQTFAQKQETEKHFAHVEDELISLQSTLEFFSSEGEGNVEMITGHEEETKEEIKEEKRKMIMGVDFSDAIQIPKKTKTK